jgi:diaminohydroxyphosphoribosylaminopyrimidine deaminase / 5-amino-6-(5-phosphoribosylamino)uracil reductase
LSENSREIDRRWMTEALSLAAQGAGRVSPNPLVGAVIVAPDGTVAGRGWHERAGAPHAEIAALGEAGERARGATLYINLEPCAHQGRTPPCAPEVVRAGVSRVVAAIEDPDPRVAGQGFEILRAGGVAVESGLMALEAARLNEVFISSILNGRPFVTLKMAMSLDGRIATREGESQWITGEASRALSHEFRDQIDAILIGVETLLKDDPLLTARPQGKQGKPLIRIVLDSHLRTPPAARVLPPDQGVATIIAALEGSDPKRAEKLEKAGAQVLYFSPEVAGRVAIYPLLEALGERGVRHLLVEGGGQVHGSFMRQGLADKVMAYIAPMIIGDDEAPGAVSRVGTGKLSTAPKLSYVEHEQIGDDILIQGYLKDPVWIKYQEKQSV